MENLCRKNNISVIFVKGKGVISVISLMVMCVMIAGVRFMFDSVKIRLMKFLREI